MISYKLDELTRSMKLIAEEVKHQEALLQGDAVQARETAEKRADDLERQLARLKSENDDLRTRVSGQTRQLQEIRRALNGAGKNPLATHARAVFGALMQADPTHRLVRGDDE